MFSASFIYGFTGDHQSHPYCPIGQDQIDCARLLSSTTVLNPPLRLSKLLFSIRLQLDNNPSPASKGPVTEQSFAGTIQAPPHPSGKKRTFTHLGSLPCVTLILSIQQQYEGRKTFNQQQVSSRQ